MSLEEAIVDLMSRSRVLIASDFDGVLAPLAETPASTVPDLRALELLGELADTEGVEVAVISGRAHHDLAALIGELPGVTLVGEHGNDYGLKVDDRPELREARSFVGSLHDELPAAIVEQKAASVTFHTRPLERVDADSARRAIEKWVGGRAGITLLEGKEVLELTVATRTKGDAIEDLARDTGGVVYLGDDVTDESVFELLGPGDVGIKVGPGETAAKYRVADVGEVVGVLQLIASASGRRDQARTT